MVFLVLVLVLIFVVLCVVVVIKVLKDNVVTVAVVLESQLL